MARKRGQPVTEDQIDQIIALKLDQEPVLAIAAKVNVDKNTVVKYWHRYLDGISEERREAQERKQSEVIARLSNVAEQARRDQKDARQIEDDAARHLAITRHRAEERMALRQLSQIAGWDAPVKVSATFETMTEDEARAALDRL